MSYSLQQAATATGKDRSTIQRAIKSGKISATTNEAGAYQIDPAELHRVFPPVANDEGKTVALQQTATALQGEIESENRELRAKVELLREMVDDLRGERDKEAEERRRLTLILTDQRQPTAAPQAEPLPLPPPPTPAAFLGASVRFWFALAVVASLAASGAAGWLWWNR